MDRKLLIVAVMFVGLGHGIAQDFKSSVVDANSGKVLPYARIVIGRNKLRAVANQEGKFAINLDPQYNSDTIVVSMVGYHSLKKTVKDFRDHYWTYWTGDPKIALAANPSENKKMNDSLNSYIEKKVGNRKGITSVSFESTEGGVASELATLVPIKTEKGFIKDVNFPIAGREQDSVLFMVNIYKAINGVPGETMLNEPVYVMRKIEKGVLTVDLQKHQVYVEDDFFIAITWLMSGEGKKLRFDSKLGGASTYTRLDGDWEKFPVASFNFFATLLCNDK